MESKAKKASHNYVHMFGKESVCRVVIIICDNNNGKGKLRRRRTSAMLSHFLPFFITAFDLTSSLNQGVRSSMECFCCYYTK